jgi:hypothetical protein
MVQYTNLECYDCGVQTFVPNRTIRPKPLPPEPNWFRRFLMALAKF